MKFPTLEPITEKDEKDIANAKQAFDAYEKLKKGTQDEVLKALYIKKQEEIIKSMRKKFVF